MLMVFFTGAKKDDTVSLSLGSNMTKGRRVVKEGILLIISDGLHRLQALFILDEKGGEHRTACG